MNWLDRLEKRYRKYAISNLMYYVILLNLVGFCLIQLGIVKYFDLLLIPQLVYQGQVWRILSFLLVPFNSSPIFIIFTLMFYYWIGNSLEQYWGAFRFNVYYFSGLLLTIIASFVLGIPVTSAQYLNFSLIFAFATLFPNEVIRFNFIIPLKIKYLAYIYAFTLILPFVKGGADDRLAIIVSLLNFLIYFSTILNTGRKQQARKKKYQKQLKPKKETFHKCTVCGITEKDDPNIQFRYCSKCEGHHEYCENHLFNHKHIGKKHK